MPARADHAGKAWCYKHECPPNDCFELHNPTVKKVEGALTAEQHNAAIVKEHIRRQAAHFENEARKAQKKFESFKKG